MASILDAIYQSAVNSITKVELPRRVIIRNVRLGITLRFLQILIVAFVCWMLLNNSDYIRIEQPDPAKMGVKAFWDDAGGADYEAQNAVDMNASVCATPELYDYVYSKTWRYTGYTCVTPAKKMERMWKESDSLYVPLSYEETRYKHMVPPPSGNCTDLPAQSCPGGSWTGVASVCECAESGFHFVAGAEAFVVTFDHGYRMEYKPSNGLLSAPPTTAQSSDVSCNEDKKSICDVENPGDGKTHELRTIIVLDMGEGEEKFIGYYDAPQLGLQVPLKTLLAEAGLALDGPGGSGPNLLYCDTPGAEENCSSDVKPLPTIRQTGMTLDVNLAYTNRFIKPDLPESCTDCTKDHVGPICKATILLTPGWVSRQQSDCDAPKNSAVGDADCTLRYNYGIQIQFNAAGSFGVIDPFTIILALGAAIVYLTLPLIIMNNFAMYLLGGLSQVYYKATREEVSMAVGLSSFVSRMIISQNAFKSVTGGDDIDLTKEMLLERIQQGVADSGEDSLDEKEQIRLTEIVMHAIDEKDTGTITMSDFMNAATRNDPVNLKNTMTLFDVDRKPCILERLFTPASWNHSIQVKPLFKQKEDGDYDLDAIQSSVDVHRQQQRNSHNTIRKLNKDAQEEQEKMAI